MLKKRTIQIFFGRKITKGNHSLYIMNTKSVCQFKKDLPKVKYSSMDLIHKYELLKDIMGTMFYVLIPYSKKTINHLKHMSPTPAAT